MIKMNDFIVTAWIEYKNGEIDKVIFDSSKHPQMKNFTIIDKVHFIEHVHAQIRYNYPIQNIDKVNYGPVSIKPKMQVIA
jgi:hypothetical protein